MARAGLKRGKEKEGVELEAKVRLSWLLQWEVKGEEEILFGFSL